MEFASYTHVGGRENNEDSHGIFKKGDGTLCIVADGLGGLECGEVASQMAVDIIGKEYGEESFDTVAAIKAANTAIIANGVKQGRKMCTTVATVTLGATASLFANVGDTRIYAFKNNDIVFQSTDHSASQMAVLVGEITPDQIRFHADRNRLIRVVGSKEEVKVDTTELNNSDFDAILICSDGFWEYIFENEMCRLLKHSRSAEEWLEKMRKLVDERAPEDRDNNTAIVGRR